VTVPVNSSGSSRRPIGVGAVVALAAVVAFGLWLLLRDSGGGEQQKVGTANSIAVSAKGLDTIAGAVKQPLYWAGPRANVTYELTESPDGRAYVRYLPKGTAVGTRTPHLTVGTYHVPNAFKATRAVAREQGSVTIPTSSGWIAFFRQDRPTNVYVAHAGSPYQIEVYDPSAKLARQVVARGQIQPVIAGSKGKNAPAAQVGAVAASPESLKKLANSLGHPIYWAGERNGETYELTQTPDGRVYVRYLPSGVKPGVDRPYLTVATYPVTNALAVTRAAAKGPGAVGISIGNGVAFYSKSRPTNVYVAFPGVNEQIEVFAPSAQSARRLVAAHLVRPVS
jgi:hypothetical protein